jgi:hypothetical protein
MIVQPRGAHWISRSQVHRYSLQILSTAGSGLTRSGQLFARRLARRRCTRTGIDPVTGGMGARRGAAVDQLYNRRGKAAFCLPGRTRFGIGVTTPTIRTRRPTK